MGSEERNKTIKLRPDLMEEVEKLLEKVKIYRDTSEFINEAARLLLEQLIRQDCKKKSQSEASPK